MAGDSEARLKERDDSAHIVRQPFLIGVSGGTASGKVGTLDTCSDGFPEATAARLCGSSCDGHRLLGGRVARRESAWGLD